MEHFVPNIEYTGYYHNFPLLVFTKVELEKLCLLNFTRTVELMTLYSHLANMTVIIFVFDHFKITMTISFSNP